MIPSLAEPSQLHYAPIPRSFPLAKAPCEPYEKINRRDADPVTSCVLAALREKGAGRRGRERRNERRYPYPHPIYLTPLGADGPLPEQTVQVYGKHLSEHGLDFYHRQPLPYRRMIASLPVDGGWVGLVLDLKWCRFTTEGLYDNGGRFVATAPSPLAK